MIRCLILEDEKAARELLALYIDKTPFLESIGVYESGLDIPKETWQQTHLLFLDIQLPDINGMVFLKSLINPPKVIVTTAYADYAVEAFEANVLDYLVKPFSYERFLKSVTRAKNEVQKTEEESDKELLVYADKTLHKIYAEEILYLKAEVDYVKIVTKVKSLLVLDSLQHWEEKLSGLHFVRTHRSYIINAKKIDKVSGNKVFVDDLIIPIGKLYKKEFLQRTGYTLSKQPMENIIKRKRTQKGNRQSQ